MKRVSDYKGTEAVKVIAKLMVPIMGIFANKENVKVISRKPIEMISGLMENSAKEILSIFAILSDKDPNSYANDCDGVDVLNNIQTMASDEKLMELFISQGQTGDATSSGSASEITEAQ